MSSPLTQDYCYNQNFIKLNQSCIYVLRNDFIFYTGQIPAPFLMAAIFDDSCWLWQDNCGTPGACWIYDTKSISWGITQLGMMHMPLDTYAQFFYISCQLTNGRARIVTSASL